MRFPGHQSSLRRRPKGSMLSHPCRGLQWNDDDGQDFMHGFTAVYGINKGIQSC